MAAKKKENQKTVVERKDNGNIVITFTIDKDTLSAEKKRALQELSKTITIPGFRKGKAPLAKVESTVKQEDLINNILSHILPKLLEEAITTHKLRLAIYPKFKLIRADDNSDWIIEAETCELPEIKLKDYKKELKKAIKSGEIWVPGKDKNEENKEPTTTEKQNMALEVLLKNTEGAIPDLLIEEETNARLSILLERLEKLGMNLDQYLASRGKTPQTLRQEYAKQAKDTFLLDLALVEVARENSLEIDQKELKEALSQEGKSPSAQQKSAFEHALTKKAAIDYLVSLM